jgi:hypothetical protein
MRRRASVLLVGWLIVRVGVTVARAQDASRNVAGDSGEASPASTELRTFIVEKPPGTKSETNDRRSQSASEGDAGSEPPRAHDVLSTTVGLGYVQGADWGVGIGATGAVVGVQVQLDSLVTGGPRGATLDHGSLALEGPAAKWRAEAGDIFSSVRGAARGARLSWHAFGDQEAAVSVYGDRPGSPAAPTAIGYRDRFQWHSQTVIDAEILSDGSHYLRSRLNDGRVTFETSYRRTTAPFLTREMGIDGSVAVWRRVAANASVFRVNERADRFDAATFAVRVPIARSLDLALERAFATAPQNISRSVAVSASMSAGEFHAFHRFQHSENTLTDLRLASAIERDQLQSAVSLSHGPRVNLALQTATEWQPNGLLDQWEELQAAARLTRTTTLQLVAPVSRLVDESRLRARLTQQLRANYVLDIEFGRLSTFQGLSFASDRARLKLMVYRTFGVPTPIRGGQLHGRVADEHGRGVAGARVKLGPYTTDSDADGAYMFDHLPAGDYDLLLDETHLPADYAWDGRRLHIAITSSSRLDVPLLVAPLNAIHGRVYVDRNGNGRFDIGEGVADAVVRLGDRVTSTDRDGAYSFFNVWPGTYALALDRSRLAATLEVVGPADLTVTLDDARPVTGADFQLRPKTKPVNWGRIK